MKSNQKFVAAGNRKTHHQEKESDWLIFHCKIEQTIKKEANKVVRANMKSFIEELYWYIYISKQIMRLSSRVEFIEFDYDSVKILIYEVLKYSVEYRK